MRINLKNHYFPRVSRPLAWIQAVALTVLIGLPWLVTRDMFDGAIVSQARALNNPDGLYFFLMNANWPLAVWFYKACFALSDLLGVDYIPIVKLAATGMLISLYFDYVLLTQRLFGIHRNEAKLVGLLCLASPALYIVVNLGVVPLLMCVWLFFLGHRLFWHPNVGVRLAGLATLAVSFQLNSNLVFALALDLVFLARFPELRMARLKWFLLLFLMAVLVYASMRLLSPPRGVYAEYNQILNPLYIDDVRRMVRAAAMFLTWGIIPLSALAVVAVTVWWRDKIRGGNTKREKIMMPADLKFAIAATAFLCAAAASPYVLVGKGPPLFTYLGLGNSLTEQVLMASHKGPFAPTWANTSARHGLLYAVPIALLTWFILKIMLNRLQLTKPLSHVLLFFLALPGFLVWVLPAFKNRLDMQYAEISLVKAFALIPPAAAGVVDLRYEPVSDWTIWPAVGAKILREAWGSSAYYAIFHSVPAYRDDVQWLHHAHLRNSDGVQSPVIQHSQGMDKYPGPACQTYYQATLQSASLWATLVAGLDPLIVPPAQIRLIEAACVLGRELPNPTPEKKVIY